jgi:predicted kinase
MSNPTRYSEMQKNLKARWRPEWSSDPGLAEVAGIFHRLFQVTDFVASQGENLRASGKFSTQGLTEEVRAIAKRDAVPAILRAAQLIEAARAEIAAKRAGLALPKADPTDAAGAVLRAEMRTYLKAMPRGEAVAKLMAPDVDERLLIAAIEVPAAMLGPLGDARPELEAHVLEARHAAAVKRLEEREEAIDLANAALAISSYQIRQETNFPEGAIIQFDGWMRTA